MSSPEPPQQPTTRETTLKQPSAHAQPSTTPSLSLPKGGGAIRGIGENFVVTPTGAASTTIPINTSPGRSDFDPQLHLSYDTASGNGTFGFGWTLSHSAITRKTSKGLPRYEAALSEDTFVLSGFDDLVPVFDAHANPVCFETLGNRYTVELYRPRVEGLFARIERWTKRDDHTVHWRTLSTDNVLTIYGKDSNSIIADPDDHTRVFSWLICEKRDDKGNAIVFVYKPEDGSGVDLTSACERNRGSLDHPRRSANRYLKAVKYGNRTPLLHQDGRRPLFLEDLPRAQRENIQWLFEVVMDYGEHDTESPSPAEDVPWAYRSDPFSSYRSGFEVRTTRLCHRILMFHHVPGEHGYDGLVSSTDFTYSHQQDPAGARNPVYTFLQTVCHTGYRRVGGHYVRKCMPPVEFEYTKPVVQDKLEEVDMASLDNLPMGLDGSVYRWTDLHGEGVPGILTEQAGAWFYKRNVSPASRELPLEFRPLEQVLEKPNVGLANGSAQLIDLAGDGLVDVVLLDGAVTGFYEHDEAEGWRNFRPFTSRLRRDMQDPNVRLVDLSGDGLKDFLISEDAGSFLWHPSKGEKGFGEAVRVVQHGTDDEHGPHLVFSNSSQSIFLADLSGDGLTDILRIENGGVCYWPNLGYGRFGAKVVMDNAPVFDNPDHFRQARIRLADIDGSGTTDIIYLHRDGVHLYFNQSGNSWSSPQVLRIFPRVDELSSVTAIDLLGNGTACLVWSSPLPGNARRPMRYVSLMGGQKPHLLERTVNNLGAETVVTYAPSTKFYSLDKDNDAQWVSKLPFPVHVVEQVETIDRINRNRFVTRYAYHHGHYDGVEREFCGFGMVEQWDTEEFDVLSSDNPDLMTRYSNTGAVSHVPPVHTKTWFHTGMYHHRARFSREFEKEYYREPGLSDVDFHAQLLPDTILPFGLNVDEKRDACRALKGAMLRQEVYADDAPAGSSAAMRRRALTPYTVVEQDFTIHLVQSQVGNSRPIFFTHSRETVTYHYERNSSDPRVQHVLVLETDDFGNTLKEVTIGYGRRRPDSSLLLQVDRDRQTRPLIMYKENQTTNAISDLDSYPHDYRAPLPCETRTFELTGITPEKGAARFSFDDWTRDEYALLSLVTEISYEKEPDHGSRQKRLFSHVRTLYRKDNLSGFLPLGRLEPLALSGEQYALAFVPGLLSSVLQRAGLPLMPSPADILRGGGPDRGGYVMSGDLKAAGKFPDTDTDNNWWSPSGLVFYSPDSAHTPAEERQFARAHFFLPHRFRSPFHTTEVTAESFLSYDVYDLLLVETCDSLGNRVTVGERDISGKLIKSGNDYRVLHPRMLTDSNRNRRAVAFDTLGMVAGTAVMGKEDQAVTKGDTLDGFHADLTRKEIKAFYDSADPHISAAELLSGATTRIIYDVDRFWRSRLAHPGDPSKWLPTYSATVARQSHVNDPLPVDGLQVQISFSYSDGFGREIQKKAKAEPDRSGGAMKSSRWIGSGWTIYNNKGNKIREYEPFFSRLTNGEGHHFEFAAIHGVSPIQFHDPLARVVTTVYPNHTYEKVIFGPWQQVTYDVNDTVAAQGAETGDPRTDPHVEGYVSRYFATLPSVWKTWYVQREDGALGKEERQTAIKAAAHANTPSRVHFDTLGRPFLTVEHQKVICDGHENDGTEDYYCARVDLDIEGNQRSVRDAMVEAGDATGRVVMHYAYNLLGTRIYQSSIDAGERWMLRDVADKPLRHWNGRGHMFRTEYDELRRPLRSFVTGTDPENPHRELLTQSVVYGERHPEDETRNLRGRVYLQLDQAGGVTKDFYDFKGNLLSQSRQLAREYKHIVDWRHVDGALRVDSSGKLDLNAVDTILAPMLQEEKFKGRTAFDALNRPIQIVMPHSDNSDANINVIQPGYNEGNLLKRIEVWLNRQDEPQELLDRDVVLPSPVGVDNIDYNAKRQRIRVDYKNGVMTRYTYDPETFRLVHLYTRRGSTFTDDCGNGSNRRRYPAPDDPPQGTFCGLQNLHYFYDPVGNVCHIRDDAQQAIFFRNKRVEPHVSYTHDAVYRLIQATGREHLGQAGGAPIPHCYNDAPRVGMPWSANDGKAMGTYTERYNYSAAGNIKKMQHIGNDPRYSGWTRNYAYEEPSPFEYGKRSNRLSSTKIAATESVIYSESGNGYDAHGNMIRMPHLQVMAWDYRDQLHMTQRQIVRDDDADGRASQVERTYYVYNAAGLRVRKVTELSHGRIKDERVYLGGLEIYRKHTAKKLTRETLHVIDDNQRVAIVETRTRGHKPGVPARLVRYQINNHLGSASLELDEQARVLSYEEYSPFGSTVYQAVQSQVQVPKRYRFTGMERDRESGLNYHLARYYAPWLGRWTSCDPKMLVDGPDLYAYSRNAPSRYSDPRGTDASNPEEHSSLQGFGLTLSGDQLRIGPLTPPPPGMCGELNPVCSGLVINRKEPQLSHRATVTVGENVAGRSGSPEASQGDSPTVRALRASAVAESPKDETIGEPGLLEGFIPFVGSGRSAIHHFQSGNWGRGILYSALAITDIFLVKSVFVGLGKLAIRNVAKAAAREELENILVNTSVKAAEGKAAQQGSGMLVHFTTKAKEEAINKVQKIGGKWGIFALEAGRIPKTPFGRAAATLVPRELGGKAFISAEAALVFARPPRFGLWSTWRYMKGVRSTPLGSLSTETGEFIAGEIFRNGTFRMATYGEYASQVVHQWGLDYFIDELIYLTGKCGILTYEQFNYYP